MTRIFNDAGVGRIFYDGRLQSRLQDLMVKMARLGFISSDRLFVDRVIPKAINN
jgi:hypothetical protein